MYTQNWLRINQYPHDYLQLVYKYYASHGVAYTCIYYHLDVEHSIIDKDILDGAAYQQMGDLSGHVWEKIVGLPIYNTEYISPKFLSDERGMGKFDQTTSFNFPYEYGITPTATDYVIFDEPVVDENETPFKRVPMYRISNFETSLLSQISFWKVSLEVDFHLKTEIEQQLSKTLSFVDYEKRIYPIDDSIMMYKSLSKNTKLDTNDFYNSQLGLYLGV